MYDNYITNANPSFLKRKMYWNCNNGSPQLFIAGGGTEFNINFGIVSPPSTAVSSLNVTGIPYGATGWAQDIADVIIDPATNDLFTIYDSHCTVHLLLSNQIYKNTAPYSGASVAWNVYSGFTTVQEIANRPYFVDYPYTDNSGNILPSILLICFTGMEKIWKPLIRQAEQLLVRLSQLLQMPV